MMRSLYSGVSGLRIHQTKMDVIGNNISNVNTTAYKASRASFNAVFSQTLSGASGPNSDTGRGGVNAKQIGLGAGLASIEKVMTQGASQRTDRAMDLMIQGEGFFVVGDASSQYFTRAGAMDIDPAGNLYLLGNGLCVYGWDADNETGEVTKGTVQPIVIAGDKMNAPAKATTNVEFTGNLKFNDKTIERTIEFYDSIGTRYTMNITFEYDETANADAGGWTATLENNGTNIIAYVNGDKDKEVQFPITAGSAAVAFQFDDQAKPIKTGTPPFVGMVIDFGDTPVATGLSPEASFGNAGEITLDFSGLTQFGVMQTSALVSANGRTAGELQDVSIGSDGKINGRYSNGDIRCLAQIPVARFKNPAGLESVGDNLYAVTANSGSFNGVGEEAQIGNEKLIAGTLEMSNVDLAGEFTDMITTQRGFQANSRIITVSDEMLQELVNLKR